MARGGNGILRVMHERVLKLIVATIEELNESMGKEALKSPTLDTSLYGRHGALDSLGLVNLIADLEGRIRDDFGRDVILADDRAMSVLTSPFRTVRTLSAYIEELLGRTE